MRVDFLNASGSEFGALPGNQQKFLGGWKAASLCVDRIPGTATTTGLMAGL
jgi:hypothetical protein